MTKASGSKRAYRKRKTRNAKALKLVERKGKVDEINVRTRSVGVARRVPVKFQAILKETKVFRNGVLMSFPVEKFYVADTAHHEFATELTRLHCRPLRSSFAARR